MSTDVVLAVSNALGVEPHDLQPRLYDVLDPDALDQLFEDPIEDSSFRLVFELAGCTVCVHGDGSIRVLTDQ